MTNPHAWPTTASRYQLNLSTRDACASVACSFGSLAIYGWGPWLGIVTSTEVVFVRMHHHGPADYSELSLEFNQLVDHLPFGDPISTRLDVAQVPYVPLLVSGGAMSLLERVVMRTSTVAAVAEVGFFVHVKAVLACTEAFDVVGDLAGVCVSLFERDGAAAPWSLLCASPM